MAVVAVHGVGDAQGETRTQRLFNNLNPLMGAVIGLVVLVLFGYAIYATVDHLSTAPVSATETQDGYSPFDRAVQVVGLVSPVLTIVLGFYFGTRAGAGDAQAAAAVAQTQVESAQLEATKLREVIEEVRNRGDQKTSQIVNEVASERSLAVQPPPT